jgi:hypothetical protein
MSKAFNSHGMSNTRIYRIWHNMKTRCYTPSRECFKNYGGRGITVCDEWLHDFPAFYEWSINNGYSEHLTLDRYDNNGNYTPENCRWATRKEKTENRRNSVIIEIGGEKKTAIDWAKESGVPYRTFMKRYYSGATGADLIRAVGT